MKITHFVIAACCEWSKATATHAQALEALLKHIEKKHPACYARLEKGAQRMATKAGSKLHLSQGDIRLENLHRFWILSMLEKELDASQLRWTI